MDVWYDSPDLKSILRPLPTDVRSALRSGISITSFSHCIEELVLNSIDAEATSIVVGVDFTSFRIRVSDNGFGIPKHDLEKIGSRYTTSKCHSLADLSNLRYYGFRGEALASILEMAGEAELLSRAKVENCCYIRTFSNGKPNGNIRKASGSRRMSQGLTVTLNNFMGRYPVRQNRIDRVLEIEEIKILLERILLMNPRVSLQYNNEAIGVRILSIRSTNSIVSSFKAIYGSRKQGLTKHQNLVEIYFSFNIFFIKAFVSKISHHTKAIQLVYVNKRFISRTKIHRALHQAFSTTLGFGNHSGNDSTNMTTAGGRLDKSSSQEPRTSEKYPVFVVDIQCPLSEYDITFAPRKTIVEFKHWDTVMQGVTGLNDRLKVTLQSENSLVVVRKFAERSRRVPTSALGKATEKDESEPQPSTSSNFRKESEHLKDFGKTISTHAMRRAVHSRVAVRGGEAVAVLETESEEEEESATNKRKGSAVKESSEDEDSSGFSDDFKDNFKKTRSKTKEAERLHLSTVSKKPAYFDMKTLKRKSKLEESAIYGKKLRYLPPKATRSGVAPEPSLLKHIKDKFSPWRVKNNNDQDSPGKKKLISSKGSPKDRKRRAESNELNDTFSHLSLSIVSESPDILISPPQKSSKLERKPLVLRKETKKSEWDDTDDGSFNGSHELYEISGNIRNIKNNMKKIEPENPGTTSRNSEEDFDIENYNIYDVVNEELKSSMYSYRLLKSSSNSTNTIQSKVSSILKQTEAGRDQLNEIRKADNISPGQPHTVARQSADMAPPKYCIASGNAPILEKLQSSMRGRLPDYMFSIDPFGILSSVGSHENNPLLSRVRDDSLPQEQNIQSELSMNRTQAEPAGIVPSISRIQELYRKAQARDVAFNYALNREQNFGTENSERRKLSKMIDSTSRSDERNVDEDYETANFVPGPRLVNWVEYTDVHPHSYPFSPIPNDQNLAYPRQPIRNMSEIGSEPCDSQDLTIRDSSQSQSQSQPMSGAVESVEEPSSYGPSHVNSTSLIPLSGYDAMRQHFIPVQPASERRILDRNSSHVWSQFSQPLPLAPHSQHIPPNVQRRNYPTPESTAHYFNSNELPDKENLRENKFQDDCDALNGRESCNIESKPPCSPEENNVGTFIVQQLECESSLYFSPKKDMDLSHSPIQVEIPSQDVSEYFPGKSDMSAIVLQENSEMTEWSNWEFQVALDVMGQEWLHTRDEKGQNSYINLATGECSQKIVRVAGSQKLTLAQAELLNKNFRHNWLCNYFPKNSEYFWKPDEETRISKNGNMSLAKDGNTILGSAIRLCLKGDTEFLEKVSSKWKEGHLVELDIAGNTSSVKLGSSTTGLNNVRVCEYWERPMEIPELPVQNLCSPELNFWNKKADQSNCRFSKEDLNRVIVLAQLDKKFIVAKVFVDSNVVLEKKVYLIIFDQHAVHERIRLEQFLAETYKETESGNKEIISMCVNPPISLNFNESDIRIMNCYKEELLAKGIKVDFIKKDDSSSCKTVKILAVPKCFVEKISTQTFSTRESAMSGLIISFIQDEVQNLMKTKGSSQTLPKIIFNILCSQACHGAIKFGDELTLEVCQELINQLKNCKAPFQCAHGRPVLVPLMDITSVNGTM